MIVLGCRRFHGLCGLVFAALLIAAEPSPAQESPVDGGYRGYAPATVTGDELRTQTDLWVLEVHFKPMRMISVELTDPKTREKRREWVWYLVYKAICRPVERRVDTSDNVPLNDYDAQPSRPLFVPEFMLMTKADETGGISFVTDAIIPEAEALIRKRERGEFQNAVDVVRPIPQPTPVGERPTDEIYGVAMWRGVDPDTDYFTVFMSGFSNGYRVTMGPDGRSLVERRTLVQEFTRPGDRFDQTEVEIRLQGEPRWIYRADEPQQPSASAENGSEPTDADSEPAGSDDDGNEPATP